MSRLPGYQPIAIPLPSDQRNNFDPAARWYHDGALPVATQGWKLYVSATLRNFVATLEAVGPIFRARNIPFKYVSNDHDLRKINAGLSGYSQIGKLIVAYLGDVDRVDELVAELDVALAPFAGEAPTIPYACALGGSLPLYYRFGAYQGSTITIAGESYEDDRCDASLAAPPGVRNPFAHLHRPRPDVEDFERFLLRYPIYDCLSQGGKGGVYAAFDVNAEEFTDVILKIGLRHGQVLPDGRDGMDLIARELRLFGLLRDRGIAHVAPQLRDHGLFSRRAVLVLERLDGPNMMTMKMDSTLSIDHLTRALTLLDTLHNAGLYMGDAKLANFVVSADNRVYALDFECGDTLEAGVIDFLQTFHFTDVDRNDLKRLDRIHFLFSALYQQRPTASFREADRIITLGHDLSRYQPSSVIEQWALVQLQAALAN